MSNFDSKIHFFLIVLSEDEDDDDLDQQPSKFGGNLARVLTGALLV